MHQNKNHNHNHLQAIVIGFALIILVVSLFFLKTYLSNRKIDKQIQKNVLEKIEKIEEETEDLKKYPSIDSQELLRKINAKEKITLLDLRDEESFLNEHIIDSKNIPLDNLKLNLSILNKSYNYALIDNLGLTPSEISAMDLLFENNFKSIVYLEGGISAWKNKFNPLVAFGDPYSITDQAKVSYIKNEELKNALTIPEETKVLYIIDLRKNSNFAQGHLVGAVNIQIIDLERDRHKIPFGKKIILYSDDGMLAFQGAVQLYDMGIFNVFVLADGLNDWINKGFEIAK